MHWLDTRRPSSSFFRCASLSSLHDCRQHFFPMLFRECVSIRFFAYVESNDPWHDDECIITCYAIVWTERRAHVRLNSGKSRKCPFIRIDYLDLTIYHTIQHTITHFNEPQRRPFFRFDGLDKLERILFSSSLFSSHFIHFAWHNLPSLLVTTACALSRQSRWNPCWGSAKWRRRNVYQVRGESYWAVQKDNGQVEHQKKNYFFVDG